MVQGFFGGTSKPFVKRPKKSKKDEQKKFIKEMKSSLDNLITR